MKRPLSALAACATLGPAAAASAQDLTVAYDLGVATDYIARGYTQTDRGAAASAGARAAYGPVYVRAWIANVDFGDGTDAELDLYAGWAPTHAGLDFDFSLMTYTYLGGPGRPNYNFIEFKAGVSRPVGPVTVGAAVYYAPDGSTSEQAVYYELRGAVPVGPFQVSGVLGEQTYQHDVRPDHRYAHWSLGAAYPLRDRLALSLRYHDTDEKGVSAAGPRVVLSLAADF